MKKTALLMIAALMLVGLFAEARERVGNFRTGRMEQRRGNERSERVTQLTVGQPTYAGNGCPAGTMRVSFAPDNLSFSILFDQFVAELGAVTPTAPVPRRRPVQKIDNIICNTLIPIDLPAGMQMEITRIDYRGFAALPNKSNGFLNSIVNFRGVGGDGDRLLLRYEFKGPISENYEISTGAEVDANSELSPCGGRTVLRISNQLWLTSNSRKESAMVTLDSIDSSSKTIYYMNWRKCTKSIGRVEEIRDAIARAQQGLGGRR